MARQAEITRARVTTPHDGPNLLEASRFRGSGR